MATSKACVIGICGKRGHGKDTVADYYVREYGFTKIAFATPLKEAVRDLFGLNDEQLNGKLKEVPVARWGTTPRELLQVIGTECFRETLGTKIPSIGKEFWVRKMEYTIEDMIEDGISRIVVSDVRYPNEADVIHKFGGQIIRVERPMISGANSASADQFATHASETSIDHIVVDYDIKTDSLIEKFAQADVVIRGIL